VCTVGEAGARGGRALLGGARGGCAPLGEAGPCWVGPGPGVCVGNNTDVPYISQSSITIKVMGAHWTFYEHTIVFPHERPAAMIWFLKQGQ
jgi:hypothetical protein